MMDSASIPWVKQCFILLFFPPLIKERMKRKKNNNNLKSFFPPLKNLCVSSDSSIINLHPKTNLASPTPQTLVLVSQLSSSFFLSSFSVPPFSNLYKYNKFPNMKIYHGTSMVFIMMKNLTFAVEWLQVAVLCLFCFKKPMPHLKKILIISRIVWRNICGSKTSSWNGNKALPLESEEWKAFMILNHTQLKALRVVCLDWEPKSSILNMLWWMYTIITIWNFPLCKIKLKSFSPKMDWMFWRWLQLRSK